MLRFAVAALCVLGLTGEASARMLLPAETNPCDAKLPKTIQPPSVRYTVVNIPARELAKRCGDAAPAGMAKYILGCTYEAAPGYWPIYIADDIRLEFIGCVVQYEMAHMPPNYWGDPKMELPKTMRWLNEQKNGRR